MELSFIFLSDHARHTQKKTFSTPTWRLLEKENKKKVYAIAKGAKTGTFPSWEPGLGGSQRASDLVRAVPPRVIVEWWGLAASVPREVIFASRAFRSTDCERETARDLVKWGNNPIKYIRASLVE